MQAMLVKIPTRSCRHRHSSGTFPLKMDVFNTLNAELNPICHLLALLGAHHILHISRINVNGQFITHSLNTALY